MAAYATADDFDQHGIRQAALPATVLPADKLAAIAGASALADSYLGSRFRMPLVSWGVDLTQAVCAIAAFELMSTQVGFNPEAGHNMVLMQRRDHALDWLRDISHGHCMPAVTDSSPVTLGGSRIFSNPMRGW
jgi:phage gp36-like protein